MGWTLRWSSMEPEPRAPGDPGGGLGQVGLGITGSSSLQLAFLSPEAIRGLRLGVTEHRNRLQALGELLWGAPHRPSALSGLRGCRLPPVQGSSVLGPLTPRLQPQQRVCAQLAFTRTPHCLLPVLGSKHSCLGHSHLLTSMPHLGLTWLGCPHYPADRPREVALCLDISPTGLLSLSTGCFAHDMGLPLDQLSGGRKQGCPRRLGGMGKLWGAAQCPSLRRATWTAMGQLPVA